MEYRIDLAWRWSSCRPYDGCATLFHDVYNYFTLSLYLCVLSFLYVLWHCFMMFSFFVTFVCSYLPFGCFLDLLSFALKCTICSNRYLCNCFPKHCHVVAMDADIYAWLIITYVFCQWVGFYANSWKTYYMSTVNLSNCDIDQGTLMQDLTILAPGFKGNGIL